jgi:uncharacterized protein YozE (UPF0346 family)
MKKCLFYSWLRAQREREDRVSDLARFAIHDPLFPRQVRKLRHAEEYLHLLKASPENLQVLREAWTQYEARETAPATEER